MGLMSMGLVLIVFILAVMALAFGLVKKDK